MICVFPVSTPIYSQTALFLIHYKEVLLVRTSKSLVRTSKSKVSYNELSNHISNRLRWNLYYKVKFGLLVRTWYDYKRNDFAEPMVQLENVLQKDYLHEY